jgi:hypothetical protein
LPRARSAARHIGDFIGSKEKAAGRRLDSCDKIFRLSPSLSCRSRCRVFFAAIFGSLSSLAAEDEMPLLYEPLIESSVRGLSFADVGGLWNTENEMVSHAIKGGASRAAMIDMQPENNEWWQKFDERCRQLRVSGYSKFVGSIDDPHLLERTGRYDFVHCSGVIYHCPNPVWTIRQLRAMTGRYLLLNSMTVPQRITNTMGEIEFGQGQCLFIPAADPKKRAVVEEHFSDIKLRLHDIQWWSGENPNYSPWWWLWSAETLAQMVESAGFRILKKAPSWEGYADFVFAEKE